MLNDELPFGPDDGLEIPGEQILRCTDASDETLEPYLAKLDDADLWYRAELIEGLTYVWVRPDDYAKANELVEGLR